MIDNLYRKFMSETNIVISRALFYRLKPFWVVKQNISARDTCLCKQHVHFKSILDTLYRNGIIKENNCQSFSESMCCDITKKDCFANVIFVEIAEYRQVIQLPLFNTRLGFWKKLNGLVRKG